MEDRCLSVPYGLHNFKCKQSITWLSPIQLLQYKTNTLCCLVIKSHRLVKKYCTIETSLLKLIFGRLQILRLCEDSNLPSLWFSMESLSQFCFPRICWLWRPKKITSPLTIYFTCPFLLSGTILLLQCENNNSFYLFDLSAILEQ